MIFTFYSYKGGVGRSMALVNVAQWFYLQGLRVVMIDWDLEAPGLESFFYNSADGTQCAELEVVRSQLGLIDTLMAYKRTFPRLPLAPGNGLSQDGEDRGGSQEKRDRLATKVDILRKQLPPISDLLYPIRPQKTSADGKTSALWLLPAGWRSGDHFPYYAQAVQSFDWADFYSSFEGEAYFEWMREQLNSPQLADVVLIDSRTGVTEMGGVCTQQLADVVVSFCVPNIQNMNGVTTMVESFRREDIAKKRGSELETVVVPTRLDNSEKDAKKLFQKRFSDALEKYIPPIFRTVESTFWDLRIPYIPAYAYSECLAIGNPDADQDLEEAYKNLTAHLVMLAPGGSAIRRNFAEELQRIFRNLLPSVCLSYVGSDGQSVAKELRQRLEENGVSLWPDLADVHKQPNGWQQVTGTLDQAKSLILVITPGAVNAEAIRKEWRYARQQGVCVYPVKKEGNGKGVEFASLPLWMRRTNFYDVDQDWETFIRAVSSPYQAARVPFMPPDLPEGLVERPAELNQLKETLLNPDRRGANAVLWGPGGGGKSVLATAFCNDEDTINHFSDGILWASLGAEPNVQAELTKLYAALTGERPVFVDEDEAAMRLAERLGDRDYLMVIDGVCDAAHLKPFLRGGARCSRLVTTRNLNVITGADSKPETIAVGEMTTGEAVQMLAAQTEIPGDSKSVLEAIAQCLDKWPLLLKLFNVALQKRLNIDNNLEAAVNDLKQAFEKKGAVAFDQPEATDPNQAVAKSMSLSLARLTQDEQSHYIQLAFFPEDAEISLSEVGQLWEMEEFETKELVQHLGYHSLLKYDAENKTIHIFGVMRSFIVSQMPEQMGFEAKSEAAFKHILPEEQEIARRALLRLVRVAQPGEGDEDSRQRLKLTDFDPASQKVLKKLARVRLVTINPDDKSDEMIVQVADETFIKRWQRLHEWIDQDREFLLWRQQLRIKISEWENTDKDQGALLSGRPLAVARQWLKRHELDLNDAERSYINESARTETLLAENARRQRRSLQIQRWGVAVIALVFLASIVWGWWSYKRSNAELRKDADAAIGAIKKGNDELGVYENSLDKTSAEAASHLENAENNFRNAIENNPDLAEGYYGLGKVYKDRDKPEEALNYFTEAINRKPEHLGAYVNRGSIYLSQKRYPEAVKDYNEAIRLSPEDATLYNRRGTVYQQMNDPGLAEKDFVKAVTLKINYAEPYYHLGTIQAAAANYKQAKNNFDRASDYGYDGPEIFDEYLKLAKAFEAKYKDSGRTDKEAREGAVDSYTRLFNLTKDGKSPDLNVVAKKGVEDLGAAMPVSVRPTILIFFLEPDDATVYKEIINDLKKANKYFVQVVKGTNLSFDIPNGQVRYFHPEDEATASTVLNIVQNSLAQAGIRDKFDLIPSVEWGRRRNNLLGKIEVWIPPLPRYDVAPMGLLSN